MNKLIKKVGFLAIALGSVFGVSAANAVHKDDKSYKTCKFYKDEKSDKSDCSYKDSKSYRDHKSFKDSKSYQDDKSEKTN